MAPKTEYTIEDYNKYASQNDKLKYSIVGQHPNKNENEKEFISDIILISIDNKVRFVGIEEG